MLLRFRRLDEVLQVLERSSSSAPSVPCFTPLQIELVHLKAQHIKSTSFTDS